MIAHALNAIDYSSNVEGKRMHRLFSEMSIAFQRATTLLLVGETGTGKLHLAQMLHRQQESVDSHFLSLNCGVLTGEQVDRQFFDRLNSLPEDFCETEDEAGAKRSLTIFLKEIEALSWSQQQSLVQWSEGELNSLANSLHLIVSCEKDLSSFVEQGRFRADLYYLLGTHRFELPSLRDRLDEIVSLTRYFVRHYANLHNRRIDRIEDSLIRRLRAYCWSGNVRELKCVIERAVIYCEEGVLSESHLPTSLKEAEDSLPSSSEEIIRLSNLDAVPTACDLPLETQLANFERQLVQGALVRNDQCRTDAAKELGISRVTLYNKMKKLGLETLKS